MSNNYETRVVESFMFYLFNAFDKKECISIYGENLGNHFWSKWVHCMENGRGELGFFSELSSHYREDLVKRAIEHYKNES